MVILYYISKVTLALTGLSIVKEILINETKGGKEKGRAADLK